MGKLVNTRIIKGLRPCAPRYRNWLEQYSGRKFTAAQFMGLKHITHQDKLWVAFRLMPRKNVHLAAADIAEIDLRAYEAANQYDFLPRQALSEARKQKTDVWRIADQILCRGYRYDDPRNGSLRTKARACACAAYASIASPTGKAAFSWAMEAAVNSASSAGADGGCPDARIAREKFIRKILLKYWK